MKRLMTYWGVAALTMGALACGRPPELVDRTEPNFVRKMDLLEGTWYLKDTVVDVPSTTAVTFTGYGGELEKVRFEVQEKHLVAYRSYEKVPGLDPLVDYEKSSIGNTIYKDGRKYRGSPIAAWKIEKHFDRVRQYNAATGEQSNILTENTSDRPWYERDYMRVNWAENVLTNFESKYENDENGPLKMYVTPIDQNLGDDALVWEYSETNGKRQLAYFDFTVRAYLDAPMYDYPNYGPIPYCWINPKADCQGTEIKIRTSIRRVDEERVKDYEPLVYDDHLMTKFGFFRVERVSYDRNRAATETGRMLYAIRHNLWMKSRNADGSPIPVEERDVRPVVYYLSSNFPTELVPSLKQIEQSWDKAFRRAWAVPRGYTDPMDPEVPQMFFICQTPVAADAPAECGERGLTPRLGDIRYNLIPWIDQPQLAGPLGYGPSAVDPETGEMVHAVANVYGAGLDTWAGDAQTVFDVLTGELSIADLLKGKNSKDYVFENLNPTDPRRPATGPWTSSSGLTSQPEAALGTFARIDGRLKERMLQFVDAGSLPKKQVDRRKLVDQLIAQNPALEAEMVNSPEVRALVLASAPGEAIRQRLMNDQTLYRQVARETMLGVNAFDQIAKKRMEWATHKLPNHGCLYLAEFNDDAMMGLAKKLVDEYKGKLASYQANGLSAKDAKTKAREDIYNTIRIAAFRAVTEHELGHTVGLMHNFAGSFDSLNYMDGYWDLRKQTIGVMVSGQRVLPTTPQNLADAAKMNTAQINAGMRELQYSSIMDYGSRIHSDIHGIGKYDEAAVLFAYSGGGEPGYVEVFRETRGRTPDEYTNSAAAVITVPTDNAARPMTIRGAHIEIPLTIARHYNPYSSNYTDKFHYSTLPFHFADKNLPFDQAVEQGVRRMKNRGYRKWSEMQPMYLRLEEQLRRFSQNNTSFQTQFAWDDAATIAGPIVQGKPVEVPYMFCSDYEVGANLACHRFDQGADFYEITQDWLSRYKEYYVFNNFQRDRLSGYGGFGPQSVLNRVYGRLLGNLPNIYQQWLYELYFYQEYYSLFYGIGPFELEQYLGMPDPVMQNYWTMAVMDSTNVLLQTLSRPSAGYHGKLKNTNTWVHLPENRTDNSRLLETNGAVGEAETRFIQQMTNASAPYSEVVYVPRGPGRNMYTLFETDGYDFFTRVNEVGHFWDQYAGLMALTTTESNFLGVDTGADNLAYSLPYYLTFNKELSKIFGSVWAEEGLSYAGGLKKTTNGEATVVQPTLVRGENFVKGFVYPLPEGTAVDGTGTGAAIDRIEPTPTWSTRFYTQLYGMAYFSELYDLEYPNMSQVFRLGSGEALTPAPGFTVVSFPDPFGGGYVYATLSKTGATEPTPAMKVIEKAIAFKTKWDQAKSQGVVDGMNAAQWEAKVRDQVRSLEMMRGLYNIFGKAIY